MPQLRLALCQVNLTVGDLSGNAEHILEWTRCAVDRGAHLIAFPEMALPGYPVEDLALRRSFLTASRAAVADLARRLRKEGLGSAVVVVGYLDADDQALPCLGMPVGSPLNAAAVLHDGRVVARTAKHHLPNYGVFDEYRYFVPGNSLGIIRVHGVDVVLAICEDLWQEGGPVATTSTANAGLLLVINSSPYERNKDEARLDLVRKRAAEAGCPLAYVNLVGGQDELVFDGDSLVVSADGALLSRAPQFVEDCLVVDLDLPSVNGRPINAPSPPPSSRNALTVKRTVISSQPVLPYQPLAGKIAPHLPDELEVYTALVTGLRDYARKNSFPSVILGLSGGIDSALTAVIACDALGPEQVYGISMPSEYSSEHSLADAAELARRTGLRHRIVSIAPMVRAWMDSLTLTGLAEENLQARIRGTTLMALSNQHGHLVLATGNKSELAVGYSTLYGDAAGGFAPLKDVPKTLVRRLAQWRNQRAAEQGETPPIPKNSIVKPPSAELRPGQLDTDALPPYPLLDDLLDNYVEQDLGREQIVAAGFPADLVERVLGLVDNAEYKRRQYPPGPKITLKAFGRDRRLPITNRWRELAPEHRTERPVAEPGAPGEDATPEDPLP